MKQTVPIDLDHLSVQTWNDEALQDQVLRLFIDQASILEPRLDERAEPGALLATLHLLRGSARAIGALGVAAAAEHAEQQIAAMPSTVDAEAARSLRLLKSSLAEACEFAAHVLAAP